MESPNPITGTGLMETWLNRLRLFCKASRLLEGFGYRLRRTPEGTYLVIQPGTGGGGGWNYRGTFDATKAYAVNDAVRVKTGASQGVYICVKANPLVAGASIAPIYPEPADAQVPTDNYWEILSLGIVSQSACENSGVSRTVYINASQPF